jgi:polygalacturonase
MQGAMRVPVLFFAAVSVFAATNIRDFGAKGDGVAKDSAAIQAAIDRAASQGGGTVTLPAGRYLSGTIHLRSNITLHLENGAVLLASPDDVDFDPYEKLPFRSVSDEETTYFHRALIAAERVHEIAIEGRGVVDGNRTKRGGPKTIAIKLCDRVSIRGITVRNSPNYSVSLWGCDYVDIDGITILNGYADGIDPDSCRYVRIANCYIDARDDAIIRSIS